MGGAGIVDSSFGDLLATATRTSLSRWVRRRSGTFGLVLALIGAAGLCTVLLGTLLWGWAGEKLWGWAGENRIGAIAGFGECLGVASDRDEAST